MSFAPLTAEQLQLVLAAYRQRLHPRVLKDCEANSNMLAGWLQAKDKAITADSLIAATSALKDSLVWDVSPTKRPSELAQTTEAAKKNRTDQSGIASQVGVVDGAVKKFDDEQEAQALRDCEGIVKSHRSYPHSKTYDERAQLQAEFDRLIAQKVKPSAMKVTLLQKQKGFPA